MEGFKEYNAGIKPVHMTQDGKVVDKLEGADIPSLTSKVNKLCPTTAANGRGLNSVSGSIAPVPASKQTDVAAATEKVKKLVGSQAVMLFMKVSVLDSDYYYSFAKVCLQGLDRVQTVK